MQSFLRKKSPILFFVGEGGEAEEGRRYYALFSYPFQFLSASSPSFVLQPMIFQANLPSQYVFKVIQYGYEIFDTVLSLNCKIIKLKTFNMVINC